MSALRPALILGLFMATVLPVIAQPTPKKLSDLAEIVVKALEKKGETSINLGSFTGPDTTKNGGPGLGQKIRTELEKRNISVKVSGANYTLKGEFSVDDVLPNAADKLAKALSALKVDVKIVDKKGKSEGTFDIYLLDEQQIIETMGMSVEITPTKTGAPNAKRDADLRDAIENPPKPKIHEGEIKSPKGKFGLEILVQNKVREPMVKDGAAFVELKAGECYVVRVHNHAELDMSVDLSVDGINVFEFSEVRTDAKDDVKNPKSPPKFRSYIVPKGKSFDIPGWHKDMTTAFEFEVSGYANSAAARMAKSADSSDIGQITAVFRTCWPKGEQPPDDGGRKDAEGNATKIGPPTSFQTKEVEVEFGDIRGSVCIRYSKPAGK